ncbi:MAG: hypothetical protein ACI8T1_004929 [Verrucomicrobiales bacterium]|jgi:hypothetical protein
MLHVVGFTSGIQQDGSDYFSSPNPATSGGAPNGGIWTPFDNFLVDVNGNPIIEDTDFHIDQTLWDAVSDGGTAPTDGIFFGGPHAVAANGGDLVGLYSPTTFNAGSSVSHLDSDFKPFEGILTTHSSKDRRHAPSPTLREES